MKRPWNKTSSANLRQNVPNFKDVLSVPENKTLQNFFRRNVPDPQKHLQLRLPCCCLGSPDPAARPRWRGPGRGPGSPASEARHRRPGPGSPAPSGTAKNDAAWLRPFPLPQYDFIKNSGPVWSIFCTKFRDGLVTIVRKNFFKCTVFCQKGQNVPKISGTFCQKNLGWTVRPEGIFCPMDVLSYGRFVLRTVL
jgi:hypothetical protein